MKFLKFIFIVILICGVIGIVSSAVESKKSESDTYSEVMTEQNELNMETGDAVSEEAEDMAMSVVQKGADVSDWTNRVSFPEQTEIDAWNAVSNQRSPYMAVWFRMPEDVRYTEYTIDFKSDHFPLGSYYSLANWFMDYGSLEQQYQSVSTEYGQTGYAGFQNIHNGDRLGIMSFWDIYCTDYAGNVTTIRPEVIYPESPYKTGEFGNEGVGVQCMDLYEWKESNWYRFHLKCVENASTGHSEVEFWVCDLATGEYTLICAYDMGYSGAAFKGILAIFLENFLSEHSGDVRTMEVRNPKYLDRDTGVWCDIAEGDMYPNASGISFEYAGSYDYGVEDGTLWIMTTGVGNNHINGEVTRLYLRYNEGV